MAITLSGITTNVSSQRTIYLVILRNVQFGIYEHRDLRQWDKIRTFAVQM